MPHSGHYLAAAMDQVADSAVSNEFSYVSDFLDTFENNTDQRLLELTSGTPRAFGTPAGFGTPATAGNPFVTERRSGGSASTEFYSPSTGFMYGVPGSVKNDKPTPLRMQGLAALDTGGDSAAAGQSVASTGSTASSLASTLAHDSNAVQGASSLLSLRASGHVDGPSAHTHERFLFTAADPVEGDDDEARLLMVLQAKYEAGLLKPYDYGAAYARFQRYMETKYARRLRRWPPRWGCGHGADTGRRGCGPRAVQHVGGEPAAPADGGELVPPGLPGHRAVADGHRGHPRRRVL